MSRPDRNAPRPVKTDRAVDRCPVCSGADFYMRKDFDPKSVDERNLSAALGAGVTPVTVDHPAIKRIRDWIWTLPPPA